MSTALQPAGRRYRAARTVPLGYGKMPAFSRTLRAPRMRTEVIFWWRHGNRWMDIRNAMLSRFIAKMIRGNIGSTENPSRIFTIVNCRFIIPCGAFISLLSKFCILD